MTAGWIAGSVRARAMSGRLLGRAGTRALAAHSDLGSALSVLAGSPYGQEVRPGQTLAEAQRAVVRTLVWNARVLAGWVPRDGVAILRALFASVEAANISGHLEQLLGGVAPAPFPLGALSTAWPRLSRARSPEELRRALTASPWGDPGGNTPYELGPTLAAVLADRVIAAVPGAAAWATGATALLTARTRILQERDLPDRAAVAAARVVGRAALAARNLPDLRAALPDDARSALDGMESPADLWQAEARWWSRVDHDGRAMLKAAMPGPDVLVGAVAVLGADAWRTRAALEMAARGGRDGGVLDAVA